MMLRLLLSFIFFFSQISFAVDPPPVENAQPVFLTVNGQSVSGTSPLPISGTVFQGNAPWIISGTTTANVTFPSSMAVNVQNFPSTQSVSFGAVAVSNFPAVQVVSGQITANVVFPASQTVNQGTNPWIVSGSVSTLPVGVTSVSGVVSVQNFPSLQLVSGAVTVQNFPAVQVVSTTGLVPISGTVFVQNYPAIQSVSFGAVTVANFPSLQLVSGTVQSFVTNFPSTQTVSFGAVTIGNFPALQQVSGTVFVQNVVNTSATGITPVSGIVSVQNFPTVQVVSQTGISQVSGTVFVQNFPSTQAVSFGAVSVSNFPNIQATSSTGITQVSGTVLVQNFPSLNQVSGTVTTLQGTSPWVISGPVTVSGVSTSANQALVINQLLSNGQNAVSASAVSTQNFLNLASSNTSVITSGTASLITNMNSGLNKTQVVDALGNIFPTANGATTGTISTCSGAGSSVTLTLPSGTSSTEFQLSGTYVGSVIFESSVNSGTTYNTRVYRSSGILNNLQTSANTFPSEWRGNSAGMTHVRIRCSSYLSGSLTAYIGSSTGAGALFLNAAIPIGGNSVGNTSATLVLAGSAMFTGTFEDLTQVASIGIAATSDKPANIFAEFSIDGVTVVSSQTFTIAPSAALNGTIPPTAFPYFRVRMQNNTGTTLNGSINIGYSATAEDLIRLPLGNISNLTDATVTAVNKAVLAGRSTSTAYYDAVIRPVSSSVTTTDNSLLINTKNNISVATNFSVGVGASATTIISANPARKGLIFSSSGVGTGYCGMIGTTAVSGSGMVFRPNTDFNMNEYTFHTGTVNCTASGGTVIFSGTEFSQ